MVLVERGKIDLDRPINDYLGEAKLHGSPGTNYEPTVREIAGHVGGLGIHFHFFPETGNLVRPTMDETIRRFGFLIAPPGERYEYSNLGYGVLEYVIERVSGRPYAEFLQSEVLNPLGLNQTSVPLKHNDGLAVRYWTDGTEIPFYDFDHRGGSAVYSSAHDLVRFGMYHLGLLNLAGPAPVSPKGLAEMHRSIARWGSDGYGLGWTLTNLTEGTRLINHDGGMPGVHAQLLLLPEKKAVLVSLANSLKPEASERVKDELGSAMALDYSAAKKSDPEAIFTGEWIGEIATAAGSVPLRLQIKNRTNCYVKINNDATHRVRDMKIENGYWTGMVVERLSIPELSPLYCEVKFFLKRLGSHLRGGVTVWGRAGSKEMPAASSFSIDLRLVSDFAD